MLQGKLVAATGLPAPGGTLSLQKKPVRKVGGAEPKIGPKRQARTTHHSRQISWSRDQAPGDSITGQGHPNTAGQSLMQVANEQSSIGSHGGAGHLSHQVTAA